LRLIRNALQRQPVGQGLLPTERDARNGEAGDFRGKDKLAGTIVATGEAHVRSGWGKLLFKRLLTLLLNDKLIVRLSGKERLAERKAGKRRTYPL